VPSAVRMALVGRGRELDQLEAALAAVSDGGTRVVGLVGEAGIGKTRLALEVADRAAARGVTVLSGRTPVHDMAVAYAPMVEALGGHLRSLDRVARAALTRDLPELGLLFGSLVPGSVEPLADPGLEQARLFEAVARLVDRLQQDAPVLLLVDDIHEADAASLSLLHALLRRPAHGALLVVLTYRSDARAQRALQPLHVALRRQGVFGELALERLDRHDLVEVAADLLGGPVTDGLVTVLAERAEGVPLFVEAVIASLRDAGLLTRREGWWTVLDGVVRDPPVAARDVFLAPIQRLPPSLREVVDLLAVAGEAVGHERVVAILGADEADVTARIAQLRAAGLVDEVLVTGRVAYRSRHPLIGEVAIEQLGAFRRRQLHAAIAMSLEADAEVDLQRLALHYRGAGTAVDPERAREVLVAAGRQALDLHANRDAVDHLRAALDLQRDASLGPESAASGDDRTAALLELLGEALHRSGEDAAAVEVWQRALAADDERRHPRRVGRLHRRLAMASFERGELTATDEHLRRGRAVLELAGPSRELTQLLLNEVWLYSWLQRFDAAEAAADALTATATAAATPAALIEAQLARARLRLAQVAVAEAVREAEKARELAVAAPEGLVGPLLWWDVYSVLCICTVWDGDHRQLARYATAELAVAREVAVPALEMRACTMRVAAAFFAGDWRALRAWVDAALRLAPSVDQPRPTVHAVSIAAGFGGYTSLLPRVEAALHTALEDHGRLEHDLSVQMLLVSAEIRIALAHGRVDEAAARADAALARNTGFAGWLLVAAGEAYLATDRLDDARALVPRLRATASTTRSVMAAEADRIAGVVDVERGARDVGLAQLAASQRTFAALEVPFFEARAQLDWGRCHGGELGIAAVQDSLEVFEQLGAIDIVGRARATLAAWGVRPSRRRAGRGARELQRLGDAEHVTGADTPTGDDPLSPREREVACLAATGLTAPQISERLMISPHTARTHLKRIHARLEVSSRAALTRYVLAAGWLDDGATGEGYPSWGTDRPGARP
jgi:DNA-binding CsgD family transcriptional regulator/tetratricopeptide (TPR) repeat protein